MNFTSILRNSSLTIENLFIMDMSIVHQRQKSRLSGENDAI